MILGLALLPRLHSEEGPGPRPEAKPAAGRDRSRLVEGVEGGLEVIQIPESAGSDFTDAHCYLIADPASGEAMLVDAGTRSAPIGLQKVAERKLKLTYLVSTHFHADHTGGNALVLSQSPVRMVAPAKEAALLLGEGLTPLDKKQLLLPATPRIDLKVKEGDALKLGARTVKVIEIAGHSPGAICLHFPAEKLLLAGDTLLKDSIARTGIPHGSKSPEPLVAAIRSRLLTLPDATLVLPGHGPSTTIGAERSQNPWLKPPPKPQKKAAGKGEPEAKKR